MVCIWNAWFLKLTFSWVLANITSESSHCFQKGNRNSGRRLCRMVCPSFWEDYYMLICWELMNSVGSHGSLSLPFVMKVTICRFVSDSHEVMTSLIVVLPIIVVVEISATSSSFVLWWQSCASQDAFWVATGLYLSLVHEQHMHWIYIWFPFSSTCRLRPLVIVHDRPTDNGHAWTVPCHKTCISHFPEYSYLYKELHVDLWETRIANLKITKFPFGLKGDSRRSWTDSYSNVWAQLTPSNNCLHCCWLCCSHVSSKGFPRNPSPDRNLERQQIDNILHHAKKWVLHRWWCFLKGRSLEQIWGIFEVREIGFGLPLQI